MTGILKRPILAIVISLLITFAGLLSWNNLPVSQFPSITPPEVNVTVEYTGANAQTVTKAALVPLERAINGVPGMKYMSSDAGNDGVGVVQILFETGTDPDIAAVNVQNRVNAVMGELPTEITRNGVKIAKEENALLLYINLYSSDSTLDEKFLYNFADIHLLAALKRIKGVGYADILGAKEYAMRIWLDPKKLNIYQLDAADVVEALRSYNLEAAPGKFGENSEKLNSQRQYTVNYTGKFKTEEEFGAIPVRKSKDGRIIKIRDLAEVSFETTYYDVESKLNGQPSAAIVLKQLPGSNAAEVIKQVKLKMEELQKKSFMKGMQYELSYDVSRFLEASFSEVIQTLIEAFILVGLVVLLFLQHFRLTLIPAITVPVSLIGTLFGLYALGFTLNTITLFAFILAIGIVIDDAIVMAEAVYARMEERKMGVFEATFSAINEIGSSIIAITLVMGAVFIPTAFLTGPTGVFYKQFSITMAVAIGLSGVGALTLTPALCLLLLKQHQPVFAPLQHFFNGFNRVYNRLSSQFKSQIERYWFKPWRNFALLAFAVAGVYMLAIEVPRGFVPQEDQGMFYISITTPPGATLERTKAVVNQMTEFARALPEVESVSSLSGTNILSDGTGASYGTCLVNLTSWDNRSKSANDLMAILEEKAASLGDASIQLFAPPAIPGYGNSGGFEMRLLDQSGQDNPQMMEQVVQRLVDSLQTNPKLEGVFSLFQNGYPQLTLKLDMDRIAASGLNNAQVLESLGTLLGSSYATNFIRFGQMYKVMVQASPEFRVHPDDLNQNTLRNEDGEMVMLSQLVQLSYTNGPDQITRYNMFPSAEITGEGVKGYSSGEVLDAVSQTAARVLPPGFDISWAGISLDEINSRGEELGVFLVCLIFIYLLLAGQYESFLLPLVVLLPLPLGVFGSFFFLYLFRLENNLYAQMSLIMLIGLLSKNAILIVEYAEQKRKAGFSLTTAVLEAIEERLRPILMTSFAFILGMLPLVFSSGAGASGSKSLGVSAAGGMLVGTVGGLYVIPGLYLWIGRFRKERKQS